MSGKYGKLKILCIITAVLSTLLLSILQTESPYPFEYPSPPAKTGDSTQYIPAWTEAGTAGQTAPENTAGGSLESESNHPAISLLKSEGVAVRSLELLKDGKYPVFYVSLPFSLNLENESRITDIINKVARANSWWDFEIVDSGADARIQVTCDRQFSMVDETMINGDRNYFLKLAQKNAVETYAPVRPIVLKPEGKLLKQISESGWKRSRVQELLGESSSIFDGYDTYFGEGVKVKYSRDRVYNIVFSSSFKEPVFGRIGFGGGKTKVVGLLGKPQFESATQELYGYKAADCYIFFTGTEKLTGISVYSRNTDYGRDTLSKLLDKYGVEPDKFELNSFIEDLRALWPDYDLYYSERGGLGISYDSIGVSADNMYEDRGGPYITIYGNFEGVLDSSLELPKKTEGLADYSSDLVQLQLDSDSIFEAEKRRLDRSTYINGLRQGGGALSPDGAMKVTDNGGSTYEHAGLFIFSMDGARPDRELRTGHFTGKTLWLDSRYFIYDVFMTGIFAYDTREDRIIEILRSDLGKDEDYVLESCEPGVIGIRNNNDGSAVTVRYSISTAGALTVEP